MVNRFTIVLCALSLQALAGGARAADIAQAELDDGFGKTVQPFLQTYCITCHGNDKPKAELNLSVFSTAQTVAKDHPRWAMILERLKAGEMPPEQAEAQPPVEVRRQVINWIEAMRKQEAERNAGDPGLVLARRLSNAEYDYTIRDLTGVDIHPTQAFPVDPANEAGFDNSGESLAMSPALVKKYIDAARLVSEHIVFKPRGFDFAPYPVVTETDRDKYAVNRVVDFYKRHPVDYADYFLAAWRYKNRVELGRPDASLADFAQAAKISPKYLEKVWGIVTAEGEEVGPIAAIQVGWKKLSPPAAGKEPDDVRTGCGQIRDFIVDLRPYVAREFYNLPAKGIAPGSQTLVLWKDRQYADNRMTYAGNALEVDMSFYAKSAPVMLIPEGDDARAKYEQAFKRFCAVFPDVFFLSERARMFLTNPREIATDLQGHRLLTAGFHSQMGYFRDDTPLYELVLDEAEQRELDQLWKELDFITLAPIRQFRQFIWFERAEPPSFMSTPEFGFARPEDDDVTSEAKIRQVAEAYLAKAQKLELSETAVGVIRDYFEQMNANIRALEQSELAAEPSHLDSLVAFAQRAFRRPLSQKERDDILSFYRTLRSETGLSHEDAVRDTVVSVLMSPYFCYRINPFEGGSDNGVHPLSDYELASRLSYFLWSSMPDEELLSHAASGELHQPAVLLGQTKRMMQDERINGLATEFGANWLDIRRFEEHNAVDRQRFPGFTNELREAMFQEPIRFFVDLIRRDRSALEFLYGDYTFVNPVLAKHYGMPELSGPPEQWVRIDNASQYQRGGLLPMSVFLTKNAPGLRTSPVKRGYWVVRRLLGERIPAPPPNVPVLPTDESKLGELTLRQALAKHREDKSCSACHEHFDSVGVVFEGFGPVGELRSNDLGGKPVETSAVFPDGSEGTGVAGLRTYLRDKRQEEFLNNLCSKMLVYSLGRSLLPSDDSLIQQMRSRLQSEGNRFGCLVETIVTSPQFLSKRGVRPASKE